VPDAAGYLWEGGGNLRASTTEDNDLAATLLAPLAAEEVRAKQFDGCAVSNFVELEKLKRLVPGQ
jgi:hypothetical protein